MSAMRLGRALPLAALLISSAMGQEQQAGLVEQIEQLRQELQALKQKSAIDQLQIRDLEERLAGLEQREADAQALGLPTRQDPTFGNPLDPYQDPSLGAGGPGNLLNPQITLFGDILASLSDDGSNKAFNRFSLREVEVDFRAAIAPIADGVVIAAFGEEIESMMDGSVTGETAVGIEEGYIDFHTLPGEFRLVAGKFRNAFGRNNLLHTHDLPQVDRPLAVKAFFGEEGLATTGISIEHLIPNPWDSYINLQAQIVDSDGGEDSPLLGGPNADNPAVLGHLTWFEDTGETSSIELGGSYLWGHSTDDSDFTSSTIGLDFTFQWLDPEAADSHSVLLQTEFFWGKNDVDSMMFGTFRNDSFGLYAFGQYQLSKDWYTGLRYDYTEYPDVDARAPMDRDWAVSPYITWYLDEFIRLRLQYQHLATKEAGDWTTEEIVFLNLTFVFGSHPPHPYWVNR